jgi:hypothetical protein
MNVGVGSLLKDSRITRESLTWGRSFARADPPGFPARYDEPVERKKFSIGLTGYWFPRAREADYYASIGTQTPIVYAYRNLVAPQPFDAEVSSHYYRSGGANTQGRFFTYFGPEPRYADHYRGLSWIDDYDIPSSPSDRLSPGQVPGGLGSLNVGPYNAYGSALRSPIIPLAGGGVGMRGQILAHGQIEVPWYMSCFIRTTRTSFDFFGGYQTYIMFIVRQTDGGLWGINFGNTTQTNVGTIGRARTRKLDAFGGTLYSAYDVTPGITINDGRWHHIFMWAPNANTVRSYVDGQMYDERIDTNIATALAADTFKISNYFFDGFEGDIGFAAVGDATNVTAQRIRYLAACRTLKDRPVTPSPTTVVDFAPHSFVYYYDDTSASWLDAETRVKVWDGSAWVANPKGYDGTTWWRFE